MNYINAEHLKHLSKEAFFEKGIQVLKATGHEDYTHNVPLLKEVFAIVQEKLRSFEELPNFIGYFFDDNYNFDEKALQKVLKHEPQVRLAEIRTLLASMEEFSCETIEAELKQLAERNGVQPGDYIHTLRFAVSGRSVGPSLYHMLVVMGKDNVLKRIQRCLDAKLF